MSRRAMAIAVGIWGAACNGARDGGAPTDGGGTSGDAGVVVDLSANDDDAGAPRDGGGASSDGGPVWGCNRPWTPSDVTLEPARPGFAAMQVVRRSMVVHGATREYLVAVPQGYDASEPHALVFGFHGSGGDREQLRKYMNLEVPANGDAIFIYPSAGASFGWDLTPTGDDYLFVDQLLQQYRGELCIDRQRVFATGHSDGGCFTNGIACLRAGEFRAAAPVAGCDFAIIPPCVGDIAVMQIHSPKDTQVPYAQAIELCTRYLHESACAESPMCGCNWTDSVDKPAHQCMQTKQQPYATSVPITVTSKDDQPPVLRAYEGCNAGFPLVFVDHWHRERPMAGDPAERWHNPPPWSAALIWEFFHRL